MGLIFVFHIIIHFYEFFQVVSARYSHSSVVGIIWKKFCGLVFYFWNMGITNQVNDRGHLFKLNNAKKMKKAENMTL